MYVSMAVFTLRPGLCGTVQAPLMLMDVDEVDVYGEGALSTIKPPSDALPPAKRQRIDGADTDSEVISELRRSPLSVMRRV